MTLFEDSIDKLGQTAKTIRAQIRDYQTTASDEHASLSVNVLEGLQQLWATVLELKETAQQVEEERRNSQALVEIGQVVNSSLDLATVLNEVMDTLIQLTGAERAFLMQRDESGEMQIEVARNWDRTTVQPVEYAFSSTVVEQVLDSGDAVITTNAQADPRFSDQESVVAYHLRSILCVPLKVKGSLTGVIYADNRAREGLFTKQHLALVLAFANQAAVALENARLYASIRKTLVEVTELKTLMEDVFASIASGVITADQQDQITLCNHAAEVIFATPENQLLGGSLRNLLMPLSSKLDQKLADVKETEQPCVGFELHSILEKRGPVDLRLNLTPLKTTDGKTRGVTLVLDDLTEKRHLEGQQRLFERMVSPVVIEQLDPDSLKLGGHIADITTLFADIRHFTAFSGSTEPETLMRVLNRYMAVAAESVLKEDGTIDKYQGDAIMAWFNAPIPQPDHTLRAARAALAMIEAVSEAHREMPEAFRLSFRVGIHFGEALLGLVGTEQRLDYTAIGASVNIAKRLQENAAEGQILISEAAVQRIRERIQTKPASPITVEGREKPVEVFELIGLR
ncbi:MAG: adenylate/guanylate cyclase domain-containing protein [Anaerolineales bacterium]